jgi:GxxExxY protein
MEEFNDDVVKWDEPDPELDSLARAVIGAAIEVHRQLGPGLTENLYENGLCIELRLRGIEFVRQPIVQIEYKGENIGEFRLDLLVGGRLVVELKAIERFAPIHKAIAITYLKITKCKLALLINFNVPLLKEGIKRVVLSD